MLEKTEIPYTGAHCIGFPIHAHTSSRNLCQTTCHGNALAVSSTRRPHSLHTHTSTDELIDMQLRIRRTGPAFMPHRTGAFSLKHTNYPEEDTCGRLYLPSFERGHHHITTSHTIRTHAHQEPQRTPPSADVCS